MTTYRTAEERDEARFMTLDGVAVSEAAHNLVSSLSEGVTRAFVTGKNPSKPYLKAMGAVLCDLLRAAERNPERWSYRPLRPSEFTGERVGYHCVRRVIRGLENIRAVERWRGHQQWCSFDGKKTEVAWARATRVRATPWLLKLMREYGLAPDNWRDHFSLLPQNVKRRPSVEVRRRSAKARGDRYRGAPMKIDWTDPVAAEQRARIDRLNRYFDRQEIAPLTHLGFYRVFNEGDVEGFDWNRGGRLYSIGGGYQQAKKAERLKMTINGEAVVEIDITASHLTILHALLGLEFDPALDPYQIEGIPRPVVKAWVTMTLGHDKFHVRWPKELKEKLEKDLDCNLGKTFPLKKVRERVLSAIPALAGWETCGIRWVDLQFHESEAIIGAVERLAYDHHVPALPVHDSLILPQSAEELGRRVLSEVYEGTIGLKPTIGCEYPSMTSLQ
jgi:hypothetical protein